MKEQTKNKIIKIMRITLCVSVIVFIMLNFYRDRFPNSRFANSEIGSILIIGSVIVCCVLGVCCFIQFMSVKLKQKPVEAEKIPLPFADYDSFEKHIDSATENNKYQRQPEIPIAKNGVLTTYVKSVGVWKINCIAIVRVAEFTDDIMESADDAITQSLTAYYNKAAITDEVNMITVVCVDRVTPTLEELVNSNIQQDVKTGRLPAGISFNDKTIYIAKQKDGFAIAKYKKLRKEFLNILGITEDEFTQFSEE